MKVPGPDTSWKQFWIKLEVCGDLVPTSIEKQKWHRKYPDYQLLTSSRERRRPYTQDEIQTIKHMKQYGNTDQQIADLLEISYWSIVYKVSELWKRKSL